jgi:hypothetical protein
MKEHNETDANRRLSASKWTAKWGVPSDPKRPWWPDAVAAAIIGAAIVAGSLIGQWLAEVTLWKL